MAQVIRTLCDVHLAEDVEVEGQTWEVLVRKAGSRVQQREVDLCDECAKVLEQVAAFAADKGRTVPTANRAPAARPKATPSPDVSTSGSKADAVHPCPDCDRTFTRPQALGAHRYQAHGYESPSRSERAS